MLDSDLDEQDKSFLNQNEDLEGIIKPIQLDFKDQIDYLNDQEEELKSIIWLDEEKQLYCSQCQRRIDEKTRLIHFTSVEHLRIMNQKIHNQKPQLWNYEQTVKFEKSLQKRDFKLMWQEMKKYLQDELLRSQVTQDCKQNQQQVLLKELSNFFYFLLMNDVRVITAEIIIDYFKKGKRTSAFALIKFAKYFGIYLSQEQFEELDMLSKKKSLDQTSQLQSQNQYKVQNVYRCLQDLKKESFKDLQIFYNLSLCSELNQEKITKLNFSQLRKQIDTYTFTIKNKEYSFKAEHLLPQIQHIFDQKISNPKEEVIYTRDDNKKYKVSYDLQKFKTQTLKMLESLGETQENEEYKKFIRELLPGMCSKLLQKQQLMKFDTIVNVEVNRLYKQGEQPYKRVIKDQKEQKRRY